MPYTRSSHTFFSPDRELDLLAQDLRVEQVLDADPDPGRLVGVGGADPAPRRPDLELPEPALARAVEGDVPGHDQVRVARDEDQAVGAVTACLQVVELLDQDRGVDDAAGADRARLTPPMIPDGIARILYVSPSTTIVWPAFGPPW